MRSHSFLKIPCKMKLDSKMRYESAITENKTKCLKNFQIEALYRTTVRVKNVFRFFLLL